MRLQAARCGELASTSRVWIVRLSMSMVSCLARSLPMVSSSCLSAPNGETRLSLPLLCSPFRVDSSWYLPIGVSPSLSSGQEGSNKSAAVRSATVIKWRLCSFQPPESKWASFQRTFILLGSFILDSVPLLPTAPFAETALVLLLGLFLRKATACPFAGGSEGGSGLAGLRRGEGRSERTLFRVLSLSPVISIWLQNQTDHYI